MKINKKWVIGVALLSTMAGALLILKGPVFGAQLQYDAAKGLPIRLGDQVLVQSATQSWPLPDKSKILRAENLLTFQGEYSRREFAHLGDRLEYTFQFNLPESDEVLSYCLSLPLLRGRKILVTHGGYNQVAKAEELSIGGQQRTLRSVRFITVPTSGAVAGFSIDLDPAGAWQDPADFDKQLFQSQVQTTSDGLQICFARSWNKWGHGRIRAKLVFYPDPVSFATQHPFSVASYKHQLEPLYFLDFTSRPRTTPPLSTGMETFEAQRGYGWIAPPGDLKIVDRSPAALLHSGFSTASQRAGFRMKCPPGDYLLTIVAGDLEKAVGPMKVSVNDQPWLNDLQSEPSQFASPHTLVSTADGEIVLTLDGKPWVLNGIILQPLVLASEDYRVRHKWWRHELAWPGENAWPAPKMAVPKTTVPKTAVLKRAVSK